MGSDFGIDHPCLLALFLFVAFIVAGHRLNLRIKPLFAWYDFWVGLYWDRSKRRLYIFPLPMLGFYVQL